MGRNDMYKIMIQKRNALKQNRIINYIINSTIFIICILILRRK